LAFIPLAHPPPILWPGGGCDYVAGVALSIALLLLACGASAWLAYGVDPRVAQHFGGLELICLSRRLQWVLVLATVLPCLVLIARVVLGRTRAWWMIGLSVVLAMMFVRFGPGTTKPVRVLDGDAMPTLAEMSLPSEDEFVVGFDFAEHAYALPYRCLLRTPIVQLTDFDRRLLIVASPRANLVSVIEVSRQSRAEDYAFVGSPGNSTLVYNRKNGQFIVGVTARTELDKEPAGVIDVLACYRLTLRQWRRVRPDARLMVPVARDMTYPGVPVGPLYPPQTRDASLPANTPVILLRSESPVALLAGGEFDAPVHVQHNDQYLALWRDGPLLRANPRLTNDRTLTLTRRSERSKTPRLIDEQTQSTWTLTGRCTDGPLAGTQLKAIRVEENVYWGVCKEWWPSLVLVRPEGDAGAAGEMNATTPRVPRREE
jgi:hypothetical protein